MTEREEDVLTEAEIDAVERFARLTWRDDPHGGDTVPNWNPDALPKLIAAAREGSSALARRQKPPHDECWVDRLAHAVPAYTASIDAAVALVEKMLGDVRIGEILREALFLCEARELSYDTHLPRMILIALLRALIAKDTEK